MGNSINCSLNLTTLPSTNSLGSDIASSQHFVDSMFNFKICIRTIFHLSRTVDVRWLLKNWGCRKEKDKKIRTQRVFFNQFGNHSNNKLLTFHLNLVTLAFETRSAVHNFLRVVSTPNPNSILSTLINFSFLDHSWWVVCWFYIFG